MKAVLDDLTALAQELRQSFPLHPDDRFGGISRMPAHLHLLYYQVSKKKNFMSILATHQVSRQLLWLQDHYFSAA
jgi:hypothetical protein